jgi:ABC-type transport system involved in multi-copper enzyme maturation permease subunit
MLASFMAELHKLYKRPACWLLCVIWILSIVLVGYLSSYIAVANARERGPELEGAAGQIYLLLLPEQMVANVLSTISSFAGPIGLIFGALAAGSEYGWGTLKTILTQQPGRFAIFSGKAIAVGFLLAVLSLLAFLAGGLCSYAFAAAENVPANWSLTRDAFRAAGVAWLILATWSALGILLATLFRGTALAIGLGLTYALLVEGLIQTLPIRNETFLSLQNALISRSSTTLANSFSEVLQGGAIAGQTSGPTVAELILLLMAYVFIFLSFAAVMFKLRDVT